MLSRVAENLYWMSRYVERAETVARLLDVGFYLELDAAGLAADNTGQGPVEAVLTILGCREAFAKGHSTTERDVVLRFLTFDRGNPASILNMLARVRENARGAQETISVEAWSHVNRVYLDLSSTRAQRRFAASPTRFFDRVKRDCILFDGLVDSTLPRNEVFHFLQVGRYLERADQLTRVILANAPALREPEPGSTATAGTLRLVRWTSLLRSCSAYEAYQRCYRDRIDPECVVRYLLLDADFPRALRFSVARCRESLHDLSGGDDDDYGTEAERLLGRLEGELRYIDVGEIFERGLAGYLASVQDSCLRIADEVHRAYFAN